MPNTRVPAIQQRLRDDAESICFKCFHRKVCRAIDNQPCIECNQFTDANGVTVQQWISVKDRLPEKTSLCIASKYNVPFLAWWTGNDWRFANTANIVDGITHWMPLPQPPKNGENYE